MTFLDPQFAEVSNQFSSQIYQRSIEGVDGNVVISPLSILTAISFLMFGASGRTFSQMKSSLKYGDIEDAKFKMNFLSLMANFQGENQIKVENKIYNIENGATIPKLNQINTQIRLSKVDSTNFVKRDNLYDSLDDDTIVLLTSSVSLKANWKHKFETSVTYTGDFFKNGRDAAEAEYVTVKENILYGDFKDLDATAVQLPFKNSSVTMMFLLPNSKTGLPALESKLHQINFGDLTQRMSTEKTRVIIPKFGINYRWNMKDTLKKMGMERMFSGAAEFENLSNSTEPLKVSEVLHKSGIGITGRSFQYMVVGINELEEKNLEDGWECITCAKKRFLADRPFLFAMIQDSTVMYIGRMVQ